MVDHLRAPGVSGRVGLRGGINEEVCRRGWGGAVGLGGWSKWGWGGIAVGRRGSRLRKASETRPEIFNLVRCGLRSAPGKRLCC